MMAVGDSAAFLISADSFFLKSVGLQQMPEFAPAGSMLEFHFKMNSLQSKEDFEAEQQKLQAEQQKMLAEMKAKEDQDFKNYLEMNKITTKPTESGLIYIETVKGTGQKAAAGSKVKVHYTGTLLDGTKFDSSLDRGTPLEFQLGAGQVIKGWDEGISMMNVGGKAKLVIPSAIGYGERGAGNVIPPYAPLVFDVELVGVE
ncbi:FKBP-type peptidyl-prolyl cis-trans isomerase [Bacteroidota bacterium]